MQHLSFHPQYHPFLDALLAAVLLMVLGPTRSFFIQALADFGLVLGRKPSSTSYLLAHLKQRIDADTASGYLRGLPLTFCLPILLVIFAAIWACLTPIDISITARGIVRPGDGLYRIIAEVGGRISQLYVHEGSKIHRGDILIQLDARDLLLRKAALERRIHFTELRLGDLGANTSIRTELSSLYREFEQTRLDLSRLTITSPTDGKIISLPSLQSGELLSPGTAIAALAPGSKPLHIESWLSSSDRPFVSAGQTVRLQRDADLSWLQGSVDSIGPNTSFGAYRILITASVSPELRAGMTFQAYFTIHHERMLWVFFQKVRRGFEAHVAISK